MDIKRVTYFLGNIEKTPTCWIYKKGREKNGYCRIMVNLKRYGAHRYSWIIHNGDIPKGMSVLHKCDNPPCVNPEHLSIGNQSQNLIDCVIRGRHPQTKLNPISVKEIRSRVNDGEGIRKIGREFNVNHKTIMEIRDRIRWAHVK